MSGSLILSKMTEQEVLFLNPDAVELWRTVQKSGVDQEDVRGAPRRGSRHKVIVSGNVVEVYTYGIPVRTKADMPTIDRERPPKDYDPETGEIISNYDPEERKYYAHKRAKYDLMRLVTANFATDSRFLTLTFRDGSVSDVKDVRQCNHAFKKFMQRMRRRHGDFRYIKVVEFQDGNGRGAVHFHVIWDLPYINARKLAAIWQNGFVRINKIDHVDHVGAYVTKYMVKNFADERLAGEKAYSTSRGNLDRPAVVYGRDAIQLMAAYMLDAKTAVYNSTYNGGEYCGEITYEQYNLSREDKPS